MVKDKLYSILKAVGVILIGVIGFLMFGKTTSKTKTKQDEQKQKANDASDDLKTTLNDAQASVATVNDHIVATTDAVDTSEKIKADIVEQSVTTQQELAIEAGFTRVPK
jgi:uncharacterized protein YlxW (UPF0749 family)